MEIMYLGREWEAGIRECWETVEVNVLGSGGDAARGSDKERAAIADKEGQGVRGQLLLRECLAIYGPGYMP